MRYLVVALMVFSFGCTEEQSRNIGAQPKKTIDRVTTDVNKAMQSDRLKEDGK
jgi:hypothetical protein